MFSHPQVTVTPTNLPTSPTDAVAKASRAIASALLGSEQEPIKEEEEVNFKDPDERPVSSSRPTVQLSVNVQETPVQVRAVWEPSQAWVVVMSPLKI